MSRANIKIALRAYDQFCPLINGAVSDPEFDFDVDFRAPLSDDFSSGFHAREISFNRYVLAYARGERDLIGLPAFVLRGFRHRNYIVRRDSPFTRLSELKGRRIGTNSWGDTGTLWARAALREAGVEVHDVSWLLGDLDEVTKLKPRGAKDVEPPANADYLRGQQNLLAALRDHTIDAVTTAFMPPSVYERDGEFRRLVTDFRQAELDYHSRTRIYPAFHIVAVQRSFAETSPDAVRALYRALQESWNIWWAKTKNFGESSPWAIGEAETMLTLFPDDVFPFGTRSPSHVRMLEAICNEQLRQGLISDPADPGSLFSDFEQLATH
jgi:4,5-dihydroxyphthalate decarboxylase